MGFYMLIYLITILCTIFLVTISETQHVTIPDDDDNFDYSVGKSQPLRSMSTTNVTTDNNKKPMFTECDNYKPSVKEEQVAGTFVIQIKAQDDDPLNAGGTVRYKIVRREGGRDYFSIDNETGVVRTMMQFDRDEPLRQKELYLTVQATDNGRPPLSDICTFKVTVTDINDNPPQLDQQMYTAQVAEDLKPNSEVMRIFAYDIDDGMNSKLTYSFQDSGSNLFTSYFRIDPDTGVVYLEQSLASKRDTKFMTTVKVKDNGEIPLDTEASVSITVVGSDKQPPRIKSRTPENDIVLKENFNDYQAHLVTIEAESSIDDDEVAFELIKGKTMQTNQDQTFVLTPSDKNDNTAYITLARALDYETVTEYTLSVRIKNKDLMDTSINIPIKIEDVNDELPNFIELIKGSVVENDDPGAQAMVVRAIDKDGTSANNIVSYELLSHTESFEIDRSSGVIKSKVIFDRENTSVYHVKVRAYDNSPSALKNTGDPNEAQQTFQISIEDRNDNNPKFTQSLYNCTDILENTDIGKDVGEVKALDKDSASLITYSIIAGNTDDAFFIENTTGRIKVNKVLDYEKIEKYTLTVRAFDGIYEDTAMVAIFIANVNDEVPIFEEHDKVIQIEEETVPSDCIITVKAYDPDIKNKDDDQHIIYTVEGDFLEVNKEGCVKLIKPLDRDRPFGSPSRQAYIYAYDNDGAHNSMNAATEIMIQLDDINDNAPFLNVTVVVWYENQEAINPLFITQLSADDYDGPENGPPFNYKLADEASDDIINKFQIDNDFLYALVKFDREEKKFYDIPILVTDSGTPRQSSVSILKVIIGDRNDNAAKDGSSEIFVYKYEKLLKDITIGRVYVDDPDDWDLPDKVFVQLDSFEYFTLSEEDRGMIVMRNTVSEGQYFIRFNVTEENEPLIPRHTVFATVNITVKEIPEEAVVKSGSIRLQGITMEEFVEKENGSSKKDKLHQRISEIVNTSISNVDVFTVLESPFNESLVDVRFSAHGSPYYAAERLNNKITDHQEKLERELNVNFVMISINECLNETICGEGNSCSNKLNIYDEPAVVFTNKTSFVGVKAVVEATCECLERTPNECYNGGTFDESGVCKCPSEFEGPYCERLSIGFNGDGWAMYPGLDACDRSEITVSVTPAKDDGLIFYAGPLTYRHAQLSKDFISLEMRSGTAVLKVNNGLGQRDMEIVTRKLNDGATHKVRISYEPFKTDTVVEMEIDDCKSNCTKVINIPKGIFSINGPLQVGGLSKSFSDEERKILWDGIAPTDIGFHGCIKNFTYNNFYYNLGEPSDQQLAYANCNYAMQLAVTFGIDSKFLVAILVCIAVLFFLLLAVVVHRRQQDNLNEKDIDDTTENIINYEDEGGGECDANYDLSVFAKPIKANYQGKESLEPNNTEPISTFLDTKKDNCDKDPDNLPFDDVRHYAYEGDGNSTGSLSSLGSCTDDGDLDFEYLFSFGKRFSKLADMYDNDGSDDDTQNNGNEAWC